MNTIESTYIISFTLIVILFLINGSVKLHNHITQYQRIELHEEIDSHTKGAPKLFQPELFIRGATLFIQDEDPTDS